MSDITISNTFVNGNSGLGTKLAANFQDIIDVVNGNIDAGNLKTGMSLTIAKMTATKVIAALIEKYAADQDMRFDIGDFAGIKIEITDSDDTVLFRLDASGNWVIP